MKKFVLTLSAAALLTACASTPPQETLNGQWRLTEIGGEAVNLPQAFIRFDAEQSSVSASVGCNHMLSGYRQHTDVLTFTQAAASTLMACVNPEQSRLEAALGKALTGVVNGSYRIEGGELMIQNSDGATVLKARR